MRTNPAIALGSEWDYVSPALARWLDRHTVDTEGPWDESVRYFAQRLLGSAAEVVEGEGDRAPRGLRAYHVTDEPERVLRELAAGSEPSRARQTGDLGGGLYFSAAARIWFGRSRKRWAWFDALSEAQLDALAAWLLGEVHEQRRTGYISRGEGEVAVRDLDRVLACAGREKQTWAQIAFGRVADQPYNLTPERMTKFLRVEIHRPQAVEALLRGRFVSSDVASGREGYEIFRAAVERYAGEAPAGWELRTMRAFGGKWTEAENAFLRGLGYHGKFATGWAHAPQIVVWDVDAVRRFGPWRNPRPVPWID